MLVISTKMLWQRPRALLVGHKPQRRAALEKQVMVELWRPVEVASGWRVERLPTYRMTEFGMLLDERTGVVMVGH